MVYREFTCHIYGVTFKFQFCEEPDNPVSVFRLSTKVPRQVCCGKTPGKEIYDPSACQVGASSGIRVRSLDFDWLQDVLGTVSTLCPSVHIRHEQLL